MEKLSAGDMGDGCRLRNDVSVMVELQIRTHLKTVFRRDVSVRTQRI